MSNRLLSEKFSAWAQLNEYRQSWNQQTLVDVFAQDSNRASRFSISAAGLELDYSKNHLTSESVQALVALAKEAGLENAIKSLLRGDHVNNTEDRPALHTVLRYTGAPTTAEQHAVAETLTRMEALVNDVHSGVWQGYTGKRITDVVNIGIGGSDLGPRMVCKALTPYHNNQVKVHFVANIDGAEITDTLKALNHETTLFLVASKSFSTQETRENALSARAWMLTNGCPQTGLAKHFVAISSRVDKAVEFGMAEENVYPIWDWVGGRYSLWSAIGLPIAFTTNMATFNQLRAGAEAMDKHFAQAPLEKNLPVMMALVMFWYTEFMGTTTQAVLPYAHHLSLLPAYLQQLEMESNGKSVTRDGTRVGYTTSSIVWGTEGTNGQHSFHQLLHQGTTLVPIDFIATLKGHDPLTHQNRLLFANCVAQSQALLTGRNQETSSNEMRAQGLKEDDVQRLAPHKVHPGNRPSNTIIMEKLTPDSLGALIAAYEHKVYTLGVLLDINSFDQWGVELGKLLGTHVNNAIETTDIPGDWDSSTQLLIRRFCDANGTD
jgi:glucose-6-phosphate isomerase